MSKAKKNAKRSQKGKWGHIGAPPKAVRWPNRPFTMETLFARNSNGKNKQCELSLRNKVDAGVADGTILELKAKKQPHGAVGRPKSVFVLKVNYVASKMELADKTAKGKKTPRKATVATVAVASPAPATSPAAAEPVTAQPAPAPASAPAPVETTPPVTTAPAETLPTASIPAPAPAVG